MLYAVQAVKPPRFYVPAVRVLRVLVATVRSASLRKTDKKCVTTLNFAQRDARSRMGFTREQYLQSAQKALMFFAINVALITYHKLNKSAPDGDAAAFEAAEPKSLGEQVGSFFAAVKAFLAGSPEIGGFLAGIVVLVLYKTLLLEKPAPAAADGPAAPAPAPKPRGNPKKNK